MTIDGDKKNKNKWVKTKTHWLSAVWGHFGSAGGVSSSVALFPSAPERSTAPLRGPASARAERHGPSDSLRGRREEPPIKAGNPRSDARVSVPLLLQQLVRSGSVRLGSVRFGSDKEPRDQRDRGLWFCLLEPTGCPGPTRCTASRRMFTRWVTCRRAEPGRSSEPVEAERNQVRFGQSFTSMRKLRFREVPEKQPNFEGSGSAGSSRTCSRKSS